MKTFLAAFTKYAVFQGRATRTEFNGFTLIYLLLFLACIAADAYLGGYNADLEGGWVAGLFSVALLLPSIAVTTRRLHDIGKSGWWQLIILVPLLGALVLIAWVLRRGDALPNRFGPPPS